MVTRCLDCVRRNGGCYEGRFCEAGFEKLAIKQMRPHLAANEQFVKFLTRLGLQRRSTARM